MAYIITPMPGNNTFFMPSHILRPLTVSLAAVMMQGCATKPRPEEVVSFTFTTSDTVDVRDLEQAAKVLGRHRDLTPDELAIVSKELSRIFESLVTVELRQLEKAERKQAKIERRKPRLITREDAKQSLLERLGRDLALPVLTNESRSTVVFGRVEKDGVTLSPQTWTNDKPVTDLPPGSRVTDPKGKPSSLLPPSPLP